MTGFIPLSMTQAIALANFAAARLEDGDAQHPSPEQLEALRDLAREVLSRDPSEARLAHAIVARERTLAAAAAAHARVVCTECRKPLFDEPAVLLSIGGNARPFPLCAECAARRAPRRRKTAR